ncbi:MAG: nitroreductase family protein, partial [Gammaproteobacteria bacterium]|nr:nitroreductase family protein [Gammaproteobacteria bacterium]
RRNPEDASAFASAHAVTMAARRSVRTFSTDPVPESVIMDCVRAACTAPSGANCQPWHFVVVSDPAKKRDIRLAAEAEERAFYDRRASQVWLDALAPLGTDAEKPFLEVAPYLIAIFQERFAQDETGEKTKNYYAPESVGIATGILIGALHQAGLACLTHTPSPMGFLQSALGRPVNERPFLLLVVGYPAEGAVVPDISRKPFNQVVTQI